MAETRGARWRTTSFTNFPTEPGIRGGGCTERAKNSKNSMKHRKDSEADRPAIINTYAVQSKGTTEVYHRPERSLRQNLAARILALWSVALGGLLIAALALFGAASTEGGKEYVYDDKH